MGVLHREHHPHVLMWVVIIHIPGHKIISRSFRLLQLLMWTRPSAPEDRPPHMMSSVCVCQCCYKGYCALQLHPQKGSNCTHFPYSIHVCHVLFLHQFVDFRNNIDISQLELQSNYIYIYSCELHILHRSNK